MAQDRTLSKVIVAVSLGLCGVEAALAQDRLSLTIVVPFPEGGASDVTARLLARSLSSALRQEVIVQNRPGGGGVTGSASVAEAAPDGRVVLFGTAQTLAILPSFSSRPAYNPRTSFAPIAPVAENPTVFVTNSSVPAKSCPDFVQHAKGRPGKLQFSSTGKFSTPHVMAELFKARASIDLVHVPFRSDAESISYVVDQKIDMTFQGLGLVLPPINANRLNPLGIASVQRNARLPTVPTMIECGYPSFVSSTWTALVAPAKTPDVIVARLNEAVNASLKTPEMTSALAERSLQPLGGTPRDLAGRIAADNEQWAFVAQISGLKAD